MKEEIGELVNKYIVQTKQLTENTEAVYELVDSLEALIASEKKALLDNIQMILLKQLSKYPNDENLKYTVGGFLKVLETVKFKLKEIKSKKERK